MRPDYGPAKFLTLGGFFSMVVFALPAFILWQKVGDFGLRSLIGEFGIGSAKGEDSLLLLLAVGGFSSLAVAGFLFFVFGVFLWTFQTIRSPAVRRAARSGASAAKRSADFGIKEGRSLKDKAGKIIEERRNPPT